MLTPTEKARLATLRELYPWCEGGCGERVGRSKDFHAAPCGSFCRDCLLDHLHDCDECARQFRHIVREN